MKISKFNKRISFNSFEEVVNDVGDQIQTEVLIFECWAGVKEQFASDIRSTVGTILEDSVQFLIRTNLPEIENHYRIKFNGFDYEIIKVAKDPLNNKHTTVYAKRVG